jgi:DNA-binding XRE family transcriptional regulator
MPTIVLPPYNIGVHYFLDTLLSGLYKHTMNNRDNVHTNEIGKRLKAFRLERDMTFEQLGTLVDLNPSTLWKIENGERTPSERTLYKLKKAIPQLAEVA